MKAKRVPSFVAGALRGRKERHHGVPSQRIGEGIIVQGVEDMTRDEARVEGK